MAWRKVKQERSSHWGGYFQTGRQGRLEGKVTLGQIAGRGVIPPPTVRSPTPHPRARPPSHPPVRWPALPRTCSPAVSTLPSIRPPSACPPTTRLPTPRSSVHRVPLPAHAPVHRAVPYPPVPIPVSLRAPAPPPGPPSLPLVTTGQWPASPGAGPPQMEGWSPPSGRPQAGGRAALARARPGRGSSGRGPCVAGGSAAWAPWACVSRGRDHCPPGQALPWLPWSPHAAAAEGAWELSRRPVNTGGG